MELIQITNSKPESEGSLRTKRFGLFLCPACNEQVERPLSHGRRNKSCGKQECRKAMFTPSGKNSGPRKANPITTNPHYSAYKYHYSTVKEKTSKWPTLQLFKEDTWETYIIFKDNNPGVPLTYILDGEDLEWVSAKKLSKLYLIAAGPYVKIGVSSNIPDRLTILQVGSPVELELLFSVEVREAYALERYFHGEFSSQSVRGEWFTLTSEDILGIENYCANSIINGQWVPGEGVELYPLLPRSLSKPISKEVIPSVHTTTEECPEIVNDRSAQKEATTKHSLTGARIYSYWQTMKKRAKKNGSIVCKEWQDAQTFYDDMYEGMLAQDALHSADKKPGNKTSMVYTESTEPVGPTNCRWGTYMESAAVWSKPIQKISLTTGEVIAKYVSVKEAAEDTLSAIGSKISAVCRGSRKTHAGYGWKYLSNP